MNQTQTMTRMSTSTGSSTSFQERKHQWQSTNLPSASSSTMRFSTIKPKKVGNLPSSPKSHLKSNKPNQQWRGTPSQPRKRDQKKHVMQKQTNSYCREKMRSNAGTTMRPRASGSSKCTAVKSSRGKTSDSGSTTLWSSRRRLIRSAMAFKRRPSR